MRHGVRHPVSKVLPHYAVMKYMMQSMTRSVQSSSAVCSHQVHDALIK